jgi:diaminopimelate dehydrogenase
MRKIKIGIIGYGNVGCGALEAVSQEPDMELVGIVEIKSSSRLKSAINVSSCSKLATTKVVTDIDELGVFDVALICCPSRRVKETALKALKKGINTVDSFDVHNEIPALRKELDAVARRHNAVSIISAGWDPGINSVVRGWFQVMAPRGITYTNYGPGMSMGHTCAVKAIDGVKNALSITVPAGMGIHRRQVYVELDEGADFEKVEKAIRVDPYFVKDRTYIYQVDNVENLMDMGHGVLMERKGVSGLTHNQLLKFEIKVNNPALTSQIMVSAARASMKQKPGCYTIIELPVIDFLPYDVETLVKDIV